LIVNNPIEGAKLRELAGARTDISLVPQGKVALPLTFDSGQIRLPEYIAAMQQDDGRPGQAVVYTLVYKDNFGRLYTQQLASPLRIQPDYWQLFLGALFGALLGATIIFFWRKLNFVKSDEFKQQMDQYAAWGTGQKVIYHVLCIAVPVIWFIILFLVGADFLFFKEKLRASHDNPVAGFLIGFLAGVIGPASFFKWVNKTSGQPDSGGGG
jgi:hypothetical protein